MDEATGLNRHCAACEFRKDCQTKRGVTTLGSSTTRKTAIWRLD